MSRGRYKRSIRDLSRDPPALEDRAEILRLQREGPDMVVAITAAALIEYEMERLIIARLKRRDLETILKCTENNGPLSGLYSKAVLAYAMGVLDDVMLENVNIVRLIRNAFAHAKRPIKFDAPEIIAELRKVSLPAKKKSQLYKDLHFVKTREKSERARFSILHNNILIYLFKKGTTVAKRRAAYLSRKSRSGLLGGLGLGLYGGGFKPGLINDPANFGGLGALSRSLPSQPPDKK